MDLGTLKEQLNQIAWEEQVNFEVSERDHDASNYENVIEEQLKILSRKLTPSVLDELEQDRGYISWVLRLSPYVSGDQSKLRAQRFLKHSDYQVRYWANMLLRS